MNVYFNPLDRACKSVTGALRRGNKIQWNIFLTKEFTQSTPQKSDCVFGEKNAYLIFNKDGQAPATFPLEKTEYGYSVTLRIHETGLYFYRFYIENEGEICADWLNRGYLHKEGSGNAFLLTVYDKSYKTPEWFKGGVMYQIFPDRFAKIGSMPDIKGRIRRDDWGGTPSYKPNERGKVLNNDFFGGNFKGVQSRLPYLKALGVTVIYFNPIFEAASNHRYDTSDYMKIDPYLGDKKDFEELVEEAKKVGIRVILDGVFNHTGDNSVYFNKYGNYPSVGAYQSKDSPYFNWYSFTEWPDKYSSWWGIDVLPDVNEASKSYQEFIFGNDGVLKTWLRSGIGGYRLDVADELPDFFLKKLRKSVKDENPEAIVIGEVWEDASDKIAYSQRREYLQGYELDSVMNYPLKDGIISFMQTGNAQELQRAVRLLVDHYPKQTLDCLMNILGTHDTARILTVLGGKYCRNKDEMAEKSAYLDENSKQNAIKRLKMSATLQFMLPGVPCIYYGDENAMEGHIDPFCRRCFDWANIHEDLLSFYQKLGKIRNDYKDLFSDGIFEEVFVQNGVYLFKRKKNTQNIYIYVNNSTENYLWETNGRFTDLFNENVTFEKATTLKAFSFGIYLKTE